MKLSEMAVISAGQGAPQGESAYGTEGIPFIKAGDLASLLAGKKESEIQHVNESVAKKHRLKIYPAGSILFAKSGMSCMKGYVYKTESPCYVVSHLAIIIPTGCDGDYLKYYFQFHKPNSLVKDTAYPSISLADIGEMEINLPTQVEQQKIVNELEKVTELIALRKEQLAKLDQLIKSRFIELFGDIANGPKYSSVPLGTICSTLSGGTPTTRFPEYYQGDIPWISTPYLGNNHINGSSAKAYITEAAIKNSATHLIPANTIMFGIRVGVGKSSIIDEPMCANQDIVALMDIDTSKYNLLFIKHVLDGYQSHFDSIKKGATILGVTTDDLKKVMIPMVGIELQNLFAAFVEQTDKSKLAIQQSLEKLETLKKSLMQECFG